MKSNVLHCLLEEISEQHIQAAAWLLLTAFTQIYSGETAESRTEKCEKHSLARRLDVVKVTDRTDRQVQTKQMQSLKRVSSAGYSEASHLTLGQQERCLRARP